MKLRDNNFTKISALEPLRSLDGEIQEIFPQSRYLNARKIPLNRYGLGPFCKFKISSKHREAGVYAIQWENDVQYIGRCANLSQRFNMGYGNISPRNCYVGGQETNCRINTLILNAIKSGREPELWFHETENYIADERELIGLLRPGWNRAQS